jgi:hypothetical protein
MIYIHFVFVGEGSTDEGLVPHLEDLCIEAGADEVSGIAPDFSRLPRKVGKDVASKVAAALVLEPAANLLFVHRDADSRDPEPRHKEINNAVSELRVDVPYVAVVPVQELEAWLLLDEQELRRVAENPSGRVPLNLPTASNVENLANPKESLKEILILASETVGRRRQTFSNEFDDHRRLLVDRLNPRGSLRDVPAWLRLTADVETAIKRFHFRVPR